VKLSAKKFLRRWWNYRSAIPDRLFNRVDTYMHCADLTRQLLSNRCLSDARQAAKDNKHRSPPSDILRLVCFRPTSESTSESPAVRWSSGQLSGLSATLPLPDYGRVTRNSLTMRPKLVLPSLVEAGEWAYFSFAYSALACSRAGIPGSAPFQSARKS
jgi:hypothetical protein